MNIRLTKGCSRWKHCETHGDVRILHSECRELLHHVSIADSRAGLVGTIANIKEAGCFVLLLNTSNSDLAGECRDY